MVLGGGEDMMFKMCVGSGVGGGGQQIEICTTGGEKEVSGLLVFFPPLRHAPSLWHCHPSLCICINPFISSLHTKMQTYISPGMQRVNTH